jgi:phospholipase C
VQPDYSIPNIAASTLPLVDPSQPVSPDGQLGTLSGNYIGAAKCQAMYATSQPPVPYGPENANADVSKLVEEGFKQVRGSLTEGRYLTFEMNGYALTNAGGSALYVTSTQASSSHNSINQRWVLHQVGDQTGNNFTISSAVDGRYISYSQGLTDSEDLAETYTIIFLKNGKGYNLKPSGLLNLNIERNGWVLRTTRQHLGFSVFSVTYHS